MLQSANNIFLSHQTSTSHQLPASQQCFSLTTNQHQPPATANRTHPTNYQLILPPTPPIHKAATRAPTPSTLTSHATFSLLVPPVPQHYTWVQAGCGRRRARESGSTWCRRALVAARIVSTHSKSTERQHGTLRMSERNLGYVRFH